MTVGTLIMLITTFVIGWAWIFYLLTEIINNVFLRLLLSLVILLGMVTFMVFINFGIDYLQDHWLTMPIKFLERK